MPATSQRVEMMQMLMVSKRKPTRSTFPKKVSGIGFHGVDLKEMSTFLPSLSLVLFRRVLSGAMAASMVMGRSLLLSEAAFLRKMQLPTSPLVSRLLQPRPTARRFESTMSDRAHVPRIAQPSVWRNIIPKPFRRGSAATQSGPKIRNPANYFIWIYILIGSQAIRIMNVKTEARTGDRLADIKLRQLRDVIEKLERGEDVDVEKALGTGDETAEKEWELALHELESEERLWQNNRSRRRAEKSRKEMEEVDADPVSDDPYTIHIKATESTSERPVPTAPGFY